MAIHNVSWDPNDTGVAATYCQVIVGQFVAKTDTVVVVLGGWTDATHATQKKTPVVQKQYSLRYADGVNPAVLETSIEDFFLGGELAAGSKTANLY